MFQLYSVVMLPTNDFEDFDGFKFQIVKQRWRGGSGQVMNSNGRFQTPRSLFVIVTSVVTV